MPVKHEIFGTRVIMVPALLPFPHGRITFFACDDILLNLHLAQIETAAGSDDPLQMVNTERNLQLHLQDDSPL